MGRPETPYDAELQASTLKDEIKRKRQTDKTVNQTTIARDILGIDNRSFNFIVNGKRRLTEQKAEILGEFFGVRPEYLLGKDNYRTLIDEVRAYIKGMERDEFLELLHKAADEKIKRLETDLRDCRNELCLKCGQYQTKHLGSCNGCRWE